MNQVENSTQAQHANQKGAELQQMVLRAWKDEHAREQSLVECCMQAHEGEQVSREFVTEVSLSRYFGLVNKASLGLRGLFTGEEVEQLVNAFPHPTINIHGSVVLAEMYFDGLGVEALETGSVEARLYEKLAKLTDLEQVAVVDVLECAWSDRVVGPVAYAMSRLTVAQSEVA